MNRRAEILVQLERHLSAHPDALMNRLGVGAKTIANEVQEINKQLAGAASVRLDNGRYRLWVVDRDRYAQVRAELLDYTRSFNDPRSRVGGTLSRLLRADRPVITDELAREMSVSRSTALGDLSQLREEGKPYGVTIVGRPHSGLQLHGDELGIRLLVLDHHYETLYSGYPIDDDLMAPLEDTVAGFALGHHVTEDAYRWYTVMLDRLLTGHPLEALPKVYDAVRELPSFQFGKQVTERLAALLQMEISPAEAVFLSLPVVGMRTPNNVTQLTLLAGDHDDVQDLIQVILDGIEAEMDIRIPPAALLKEFAPHLTFMTNRLRFRIRLPYRAMTDLGTAYPVAFRMAKIAAGTIERELGLEVPEVEIGLLTSYFQVFLEEQRSSSALALRVAIVTDVGRVSARLVQLQVAKVMAEDTDFSLFSLDEATPELLNGFDLVISTSLASLHTSTPIVELAEVFDKDELLGHINRLRFDRSASLPLGAGNRSLLANLLNRDRFVVLSPHLDYRANLDRMLDHLIGLGYLEEGFREALAERERRASMAIGTHVAFPHATLPGGADQLVLAIGVIPRASDEDGLRMIVLLGVPEKSDYDDTILIDIYEEIIRLTSDQAGLNRICRFTSYEQFFLHMTNSPLT
ncbi:BglG family transcription antiterminator [Tessaracoccus caeni]|uniref:BglG family transcription antiterminator n=1 Tax=Tessaracoccus caeni TaxID=3031239 RepID=UPI0023DB6A18|nr:PRD domain-containing protein [Tessaracoccus caeni]MDF1489475.1 PRD domain-containing protein [Tessaracoccus caeni]